MTSRQNCRANTVEQAQIAAVSLTILSADEKIRENRRKIREKTNKNVEETDGFV